MAQDAEWNLFAALVEMQSEAAITHGYPMESMHTYIFPVHMLEDSVGRLTTPALLGRIGMTWTDDGLVTLRII